MEIKRHMFTVDCHSVKCACDLVGHVTQVSIKIAMCVGMCMYVYKHCLLFSY